MSDKPTSRERHNRALDERLRVRALERHERHIRNREHRRVTGALVQPEMHEFQAPVPHRYLGSRGFDRPDPPGSEDTEFPGCIV